jgi:hypothetical protein
VRALLTELRDLLGPEGRFIVIESTDALYRDEWLPFSTSAQPESAAVKSGDPVHIAFWDRIDQVVDILWTDVDYRRTFEAVGLLPLEIHRPLARDDEPDPWVSEREIRPFVYYVLSAL